MVTTDISEPSREDFIAAVKAHIADGWRGVEQLKTLFDTAGFDRDARLRAETWAAQAIDECELLLEKAEICQEENSLREYPKIIAAIRALLHSASS
jgi:hypothetical protein